jgi:hypothetical protein
MVLEAHARCLGSIHEMICGMVSSGSTWAKGRSQQSVFDILTTDLAPCQEWIAQTKKVIKKQPNLESIRLFLLFAGLVEI